MKPIINLKLKWTMLFISLVILFSLEPPKTSHSIIKKIQPKTEIVVKKQLQLDSIISNELKEYKRVKDSSNALFEEANKQGKQLKMVNKKIDSLYKQK